MSHNILVGKRGIIFGALDDHSIAWKTAESVKNEGGEFVLTNAPVAMRMGSINELAKKTGSIIIPADATELEDLENLVDKSIYQLGGKLDSISPSKIILEFEISYYLMHRLSLGLHPHWKTHHHYKDFEG